MTALRKFYDILGKIEHAMVIFSGIIILVMMFRITADVLMRNILHRAMMGTYEMTQYIFMPLAVIPTFAFVQRNDMLPKMDGLSNRFKGFTKKANMFLMMVFELIAYSLLAFYSFSTVQQAIKIGASYSIGGQIHSTVWVYFVLPLSFCVLFLECLLGYILKLSEKDTEEKQQAA